MAEAFYRLKSAGGAWTRVTGTAPITVTGLTEGAVYEYLKGDGTIGEVTAGGAATVVPSITAFDSLSGRDLTISVDSLTGDPLPSVALTSLTLDGANVLGNEAGSDPWLYTVPSSSSDQAVAWTVTANNTEGTDTASGMTSVSANLFAPTASTSPTISGTVSPGETVTLNEGTYTGTTPITITFTLTLNGADVTADVTSNTYTIPTGTDGQNLVYTETASNGIAPDATQSVTETVTDTLTLPTFQASQVFTPDPTNAEVIVSNDTGVTRKSTGICAYPHVLDVTGMADFDGVTNTAGERLNWLMYGSTDHAAGGIFLYCGFGSFATGTWKTYEDALADGDLSAYAGTTPSVTGNLLYTTADEPETPFVWKEGSTWYLISHEVGPNGQWSRYATSTSAFGPFTDQGRFLKEDDTTNHNGYARFFEIPSQADVKGPIATGNTGDMLAVSLNRNAVSDFPNNAVHVVKRDMSDTQMVTVTPMWRKGVYPAGHLLAGDDMIISRIQWVEWTDHGEMAALAMTTSDQSVFSNAIVEVATANDMYTYTREPKVVLQPQEVTPPGLTGVQDFVNPNIITDTDGQKYLVIGARKNNRADLYVVSMPVAVDTAAQLTAPRVYDDHKFEAIDISDYAAVSDIPAPWSVQDTDGDTLTTTISNGRLELINRNSLAHAGFDPSTTEWAAFWADGSYQDQTLNNESAWTAYIIGAEKGFFGTPLAGMIHRQSAQPEIVREDGGTVRETLTPTYSSIYGWPGGWEWDVTNQTVRPLHGDKTHHRTYNLTATQNTVLTGQQMYPAMWQIVDQGLQNMSVGSMYVRLKGPAHTPNAAPAVSSAATDASGSKVTVTLDRACLGRFGFVVVVGNTVVNTTPDRVDATTIDLVRDTGTFGASDNVRLYYVASGDVRSDPQWVLLPEITDSAVANNVV